MLFGSSDKGKLRFEVIFEFETYRNVRQLTVDISSDNYTLNVDDVYLENLKLFKQILNGRKNPPICFV